MFHIIDKDSSISLLQTGRVVEHDAHKFTRAFIQPTDNSQTSYESDLFFVCIIDSEEKYHFQCL